MANEEYLIRLSLLQQEAEKIQEKIAIVNQQIQEYEVLKLSLDRFDKSTEKKVLASLGKGVFFESEVGEKGLFVNIGCDIVIKKNAKQACEIIDRQINQLEELKSILLQEIEKMNSELEKVLEKAQANS